MCEGADVSDEIPSDWCTQLTLNSDWGYTI